MSANSERDAAFKTAYDQEPDKRDDERWFQLGWQAALSSPHTRPALEPAGWQMLKRPTVFYPEGWRPTDINNFRALYAAPPAPAAVEAANGALSGVSFQTPLPCGWGPTAPAVEPTLPIEIYGKLYDVPIAVQVHIVALEERLETAAAQPVEPVALTDALRIQVRQADERGDEAMRRAHAAEAALTEVVALKDLKGSTEYLLLSGTQADYDRRKPTAWANARDVLAAAQEAGKP